MRLTAHSLRDLKRQRSPLYAETRHWILGMRTDRERGPLLWLWIRRNLARHAHRLQRRHRYERHGFVQVGVFWSPKKRKDVRVYARELSPTRTRKHL